MSTVDQYREHAHDCLQRAHSDANDRDRPLWLTLAQSWFQLAEHADRISESRGSEETADDQECVGDDDATPSQ